MPLHCPGCHHPGSQGFPSQAPLAKRKVSAGGLVWEPPSSPGSLRPELQTAPSDEVGFWRNMTRPPPSPGLSSRPEAPSASALPLCPTPLIPIPPAGPAPRSQALACPWPGLCHPASLSRVPLASLPWLSSLVTCVPSPHQGHIRCSLHPECPSPGTTQAPPSDLSLDATSSRKPTRPPLLRHAPLFVSCAALTTTPRYSAYSQSTSSIRLGIALPQATLLLAVHLSPTQRLAQRKLLDKYLGNE